MIRQLVARLGGRPVLAMLGSILEQETDLPFAAALVQALNLILLTAPEVGFPPPRFDSSKSGSFVFVATPVFSWMQALDCAIAVFIKFQANNPPGSPP